MTGLLIYEWSNVDRQTLEKANQIVCTLGVLQSFANPIIFKLRNMDIKICRRTNTVSNAQNIHVPVPMADQGENIPMVNLGQNLPEIDV